LNSWGGRGLLPGSAVLAGVIVCFVLTPAWIGADRPASDHLPNLLYDQIHPAQSSIRRFGESSWCHLDISAHSAGQMVVDYDDCGVCRSQWVLGVQ
jgi:hypothetical protein